MSVSPSIIAYALIAVLASSGVSLWWGYERGYGQGALAVQAQHDASQVQALNGQLQAVAADVRATAVDNAKIRGLLNEVKRTQSTSTKDLKHALDRFAHDPVLCRFDADSMRIIDAARAAAAAAAAGGVSRAMSAAR